MPGNEIDVVKYLVNNKPNINHFGCVTKISNPIGGTNVEINTEADVDLYVRADSAHKKADIYINDLGVSIKQTGGSFPYNRLQRADIVNTLNFIGIQRSEEILAKLDELVDKFHKKIIVGRARDWHEGFDVDDYKLLLEFLMMKGSPNNGVSNHQADFILEAPSNLNLDSQINVFTFNEYFDAYIDNLKLSIRRVWYGQSSYSEHARANSLMKKPGNMRWVYNDISGSPRVSRSTGKKWHDDVEENQRKTVYFLMMEKK